MRLFQLDSQKMTPDLWEWFIAMTYDESLVEVGPCKHGRYGSHEHHSGELRDRPCTIDICDSPIHWSVCDGAGLDESQGDTE